ncbi:c-type cytochrome [Hymenobacter properus]|uniref:Cytochrome c n=1 Tax=Hymenobacter properus TaxID=2791026 RepID=A0A931BHH4_9BACT|nr:cytochrome c [Hymenobacter properus]MBF9141397.1 cytochrome c [Hymenobacter properus]MBR7720206.1 cytochrome c [Microvirga sp. SRT04]
MSVFYSFSAQLRLALAGVSLLTLGLAAGCTYSHGDPAPACDVPSENVTYSAVVSPIFDAHCRECHGTSVYTVKGGGNNFGDYAAINRYFSPSKIIGSIRHDPNFDPMPQNRDKLSDCDIQRIEKWIAAGKPNN